MHVISKRSVTSKMCIQKGTQKTKVTCFLATMPLLNVYSKRYTKNEGHLFLSHHAIVTNKLNTDLWQALHSICSSSWKTTGEVCFQQHKNDKLKVLQRQNLEKKAA